MILLEHCAPFRYPTPFSLHFSPMHLEACQADLAGYCRNMHGEDRDLAAHVTVARQVGFSIYGSPPELLFGTVPRDFYLDIIIRDIAVAQVKAPADPTFFVLNQ